MSAPKNAWMPLHRWTPAQCDAFAAALRSIYALEAAGILTRRRADHQARELAFFAAEGGDAMKHAEARPHSAEARRMRASMKPAAFKRAVRIDHAIPWRTLRDRLRAVAAEGGEATRAFLARHLHSVIIATAEDAALRAAGLQQAMPEGAEADDGGARYRAAGIRLHRSRERAA